MRPFQLALALALVLVARGAVHAGPAETQFWKWFAAHTADLAKIERGDEPIGDELMTELHKIHADLTFEIGVGTKPREFIVSADGKMAAFPSVRTLVAAAPKVAGWKMIAFRPRKDLPELQLGDRKLGVKDLRFRLLTPPKKSQRIDVAIYAVGHPVDDTTKMGVFLLLDGLLGEEDVETRVGGIDFLDGKAVPEDARPIAELVRVVDENR